MLQWLPGYGRADATSDGVAAAIVTIMLIPQSLAYALLAGLPPEVGLYASILPLVAYAIFGSSRALAVGPVAVVSLMTAAAVSQVAEPGSPEYLFAAMALALLSGLMLVAMGLLRLGWVANLLSHPVISGFITASGFLIAASQMKHILGVQVQGHNLMEMGGDIVRQLPDTHVPTLLIGGGAVVFLFWVRSQLKPLLLKLGLKPLLADLLAKAGPVAAVAVTTLIVAFAGLDQGGVKVVGQIPGGLPGLVIPDFDAAVWKELLPAALLISLIGFVESISVAQTLAAKRRQRVNANHELTGLGMANIASAVSGGFPVTGGFSRSVVNFDAGAVTPMAGVFTAVGIGLTTLFLTPLFHYLPNATLAATIIVAVLSLVDLGAIRRAWRFNKPDFAAMLVTIAMVLVVGVEAGVMTGVGLSIVLFLWHTGRPHIAEVGQVPGTEHFRNVLRHEVVTSPAVLTLRVDESLYFANARFLEDRIYDAAVQRPLVKHVVLLCTAINDIDTSALESLEELSRRLSDADVTLHLSEVKGPVMDKLRRSDLEKHLTGRIFLSQCEAMRTLAPESVDKALADMRETPS